ncbi:MAG: ATP-binding protein [Candidatus Aminicenantes bacterium]|nr:MAG: ATP-binding protein [Candidatus Aminicenantes bacterium]
MNDEYVLSQKFKIKGGDFSNAGRTSTSIKEILKEIGIDPSIVIRASIAVYEAEMNVVMYANKGMVTLNITPVKLHLKLEDEGQGIADIDQAMKEGFSTATHEMREMGFGAGMGLPNIKKNADRFKIASRLGEGTTLDIIFCLNKTGNK